MQIQELGMPIKDIIDLPAEKFNTLLSRHKLTEEQIMICRDVRRRGRHKEAQQKYRKRKQMETEVAKIRGRKAELVTNPGEMLQKKAKFTSNPIPARQPNNPWNSTTKPDCFNENVTVRKIDSRSRSRYDPLKEKQKESVKDVYSIRSKATIKFRKSNETTKPKQESPNHQKKSAKRTENESLNSASQTKILPDKQKEPQLVKKRLENPKTFRVPKCPPKAEPNRQMQRKGLRTNTEGDILEKPPGKNLTNQTRSTNEVQLKKTGKVLLQTRPDFVNNQMRSKTDSSKKFQQQGTTKDVNNCSTHIPGPKNFTPKIIPQKVHAGRAPKTNETNAGNAFHQNVNLKPKQKAHQTPSSATRISQSNQKKNNPHKRDRYEADLSDRESFLAQKNCSRKNIRGQTFVFM